MPLQWILGRSGSGKSRYVLDAIRNELRCHPFGDPIVLIVPEQASFLAEHALVTTPDLSGTIRAQVLSFRRLAYRILQETGGLALQPIDDTGKTMLLFRVLKQLAPQLQTLKDPTPKASVIEELLSLFHEMKRYDCSSSDLQALQEHVALRLAGHSGALENKLHDLTRIYEAYEQQLQLRFFDAEDTFALLANKLPESDFVRRSEFWVDGFHGFTPLEMNVIAGLMEYGKKIHITLCLDRPYSAGEVPHELALFHQTARTMSKIEQLADELGIDKRETVHMASPDKARFAENPQLAHLESYFQRPIPFNHINIKQGEAVSIHAAMNRRAEVEAVARDMIQLARDASYRWRDMAVMVRDFESYLDLIEGIFADYDIPYFLDQKRAITQHPLVELVRAALDVVKDGWRYEAVFRCVKTDFFLDDEETLKHEMDELENYVLAFGIRGTSWTSNEKWTFRMGHEWEAETENMAQSDDTERLDRIHANRMRIVGPLATFEKQLKASQTARAYAGAIFHLLEQLRVAERLERWSEAEALSGEPERAKVHGQVWNHVMHVLDQTVDILGEEPIELELFIEMLNAGLSSLSMALVPPALDQVLIGSPDRSRSSGVKVCFFIGVQDGVYPAKMTEGGWISEMERDVLAEAGLELAPGSRRRLLDDQFLMYSAFTTPSHKLWLSYSLADEEGKALQPSEMIRRIKRLFPSIRENFVHLEPNAAMGDEEQASYIAHPKQALTILMSQLRNWTQGVEISSVWWDVFNWVTEHPEWRMQLGQHLYGLFYRNEAGKLSREVSKALYGPQLRASVSRMELFAACPFAHFASYGLRLRERQVYRLEAPDIGQLFHTALSVMAQELMEEQRDWSQLSEEECRRRSGAIVDRLAPGLQSRILLSSKRHGYLSRKLKSIVTQAAVVLGEHARMGSFAPVGLEVSFGNGADLPALRIRLQDGTSMEIVGRIDRVDAATAEDGLLLRIIDYKSSQTALHLGDVYYGLSLQILTYLDVVLTHAERWLGRKASPAGALYFHVHRPLLQKKNPISEQEAQEEVYKRYQMKGLVTADPEIVGAMDRSMAEGQSRSRIIPVALKKDGSFYQYSSVVTQEQWELLRKYVRNTIQAIGSGIADGILDIRPFRAGTRTACQFCVYKAVCQFDPEQEGNQYAQLRFSAAEDWLSMMQTVIATAEQEVAATKEKGDDDGE